jgi:uncharacterized repeat protein (TIGR03806 family)
MRLAEPPWPAGGPRLLWKAKGGAGHSGIAVAGENLYTMVQQGDEEVVLCLKASTGEPRWRFAARATFTEASAGVGPHATPTVADGHVYALGATGLLHCLDAREGTLVWRHDLGEDLGSPRPPYGFSCSPLVEGNLVVVQPGGPAGAALAAFDRDRGRLVWKSGDDVGGYASPVAATLAGRRQIVAVTPQSILGVAPEDGRVLWRAPWRVNLDYQAATPIVSGCDVFVSAGYGIGCAQVRVTAEPSGTFSAVRVYQNTRMRNQFSTSVLERGFLYGFDDDLLVCLDWATGDARWKARGFGKGSLVAADDRLFVLGDSGRLAVVNADPSQYRERASVTVSSTRCWAAPTLAKGRLFLRDQEFVVCYGLETLAADAPVPDRVPWTGSTVRGSPDPAPPYRTARAFPKLSFDQPVDLVPVPGSNLLAVAERGGAIRVFEPRPDVDHSDLIVELGAELLGLAFDPRFPENGAMYAFHASKPVGFMGVSRLTVTRGAGWSADAAAATRVIEWPTTSPFVHHGGGLRFGPDGCLYVGVGDESARMDDGATGQDLRDLPGSILRLDVSKPAPGKSYEVPTDNPFVGRPGARPEIWAYGVRQPWRIGFGSSSKDLWVGDVGEEAWESVLRVRAGGNYGWSVREGGHPFRTDRPAGPTPIDPPVVAHPHTEFRAVIGGVVCRGPRFPDLAGSYVYGDFSTGSIWELRLDGDAVGRHRELASSSLAIVGFCNGPGGEVYVLHHAGGTIHELVPNERAAPNPDFPTRLSRTGIFESTAALRPAAGVVPYEVNAALWSDGASKERLIALPGSARIRFDRRLAEGLQPSAPVWEFPVGTVLVKTFSLGGRRVETRLLALLESAPGESAWRGFTYRWNEEQTDAALVESGGREVEVDVDGYRQAWHYPSRSECRMCHTAAAGFVLGVSTPQMNRDVEEPGRGRVNQLKRLERLGLFDAPLPSSPAALPRLADWTDAGQDLELRARSYLHANCAHCHVPQGGGNSAMQLHAMLSPRQTGLRDAAPVHGSFGLADAKLLAPGAPERSVLVHRMSTTGAGRMPPLATSVVDRAAVDLLSDWIRRMPRDSAGP